MSESAQQFVRNGLGSSVTATVQIPASIHGIVSNVPNGGNVQSGLIANTGLLHIAVSVQSTQAGALSIQRYLDLAGIVVQGAAITAALSANVSAIAEIDDGKACGSFQVTITNTGGSDATLTNLNVLLLTA